jgi:hypothetical protein
MIIIAAASLTNATSVSKRIAGAQIACAALIMLADGKAPVGVVDKMDNVTDPRVANFGVFLDRAHPPIITPMAPMPIQMPPSPHRPSNKTKTVVQAQGFTVRNQG